MAAIVAVLFRLLVSWRNAWIIGLAFATGHFHGREKRDYEVSVEMPPPHVDGYYFWNWSWDGLTDFWPTAVVCVLLILPLARRRN